MCIAYLYRASFTRGCATFARKIFRQRLKETRHLKPCPHCRRKVRLSPKTATVAENGGQRRQSPHSATVALFCDSRCFWRQIVAEIGGYSRQCGQALTCPISMLSTNGNCLHCRLITGRFIQNCFARLTPSNNYNLKTWILDTLHYIYIAFEAF